MRLANQDWDLSLMEGMTLKQAIFYWRNELQFISYITNNWQMRILLCNIKICIYNY